MHRNGRFVSYQACTVHFDCYAQSALTKRTLIEWWLVDPHPHQVASSNPDDRRGGSQKPSKKTAHVRFNLASKWSLNHNRNLFYSCASFCSIKFKISKLNHKREQHSPWNALVLHSASFSWLEECSLLSRMSVFNPFTDLRAFNVFSDTWLSSHRRLISDESSSDADSMDTPSWSAFIKKEHFVSHSSVIGGIFECIKEQNKALLLNTSLKNILFYESLLKCSFFTPRLAENHNLMYQWMYSLVGDSFW